MVVVDRAEGLQSTVVVAPHEFDVHCAAAALDTVVWRLRSSALDMAEVWQHFVLGMVALLQPVLPVGYY